MLIVMVEETRKGWLIHRRGWPPYLVPQNEGIPFAEDAERVARWYLGCPVFRLNPIAFIPAETPPSWWMGYSPVLGEDPITWVIGVMAREEEQDRFAFPALGRTFVVSDPYGSIGLAFRNMFQNYLDSGYFNSQNLKEFFAIIRENLPVSDISEQLIIDSIKYLVESIIGEKMRFAQDHPTPLIERIRGGQRIRRHRTDPLGLDGYHRGYRPEPRSGERLSLELEIEVGIVDPKFGSEVRRVWDAAEHDGSLGENGAELIVGFVPLERVKEKIEKISEVLSKYHSSVPTQSYGFHISASVSGWDLNGKHLRKLARTFYKNKDLVCRIARRQPNHYCEWAETSLIPEDKYFALRRDGDRLEFRIFKASVIVEELMLSARLVEALLKFCKTPDKDLNQFLSRNYPELICQ